MGAIASQTRYTPEDLLKMRDGDRYELVDGHLVEHNMSFWACYVAAEILGRLRDHCHAHNLGWVSAETTYQCFPDAPNKVRRPDATFIRLGRISLEEATAEGHTRIAPDLAVEVVSPNDSMYEVQEKVQEYLTAGVPLVWVVNPQTRLVEIHRGKGQGTILRESDDLDGEDVVPGFHCRVGDLFKPPAGVSPASK
jgi:Uma2 family endonuclease